MRRRPSVILLLAVAGCAAAPKAAAPRSQAPGAAAATRSDAPEGHPSTPASAPQQPAAPLETPVFRTDEEAASKATSAPATSRALASASDLDRAQRELEIAAGDCQNACRALGSMDRAAGKLCTLARSTDERDRCGDAKTKVQNARDRVKRTCGSCPDVTVDRNAAIPSR